MRHKHADLIIAWASGQEIEYKEPEMRMWFKWDSTSWNDELEYRIKPEWWENIPEHGVLAKNKDNNRVSIIVRSDVGYLCTETWIPLTNEEIERFKR